MYIFIRFNLHLLTFFIPDIIPKCEKEQRMWQEMYNEGNVTQFRPECDKDGLYNPVQCFGNTDKNLCEFYMKAPKPK